MKNKRKQFLHRIACTVVSLQSQHSEKDAMTLSSFLTLHIVPLPARHRALVTKNSEVFFEKYMSKKWKIHEKVVNHFVEFIGFMVCKTTGAISGSFLMKKIAKKNPCIQRYLQNKLRKMNKEVQISGYNAFFFAIFLSKNDHFAYHKPYELNKMNDKFFMDFSFFAHRLFKENL